MIGYQCSASPSVAGQQLHQQDQANSSSDPNSAPSTPLSSPRQKHQQLEAQLRRSPQPSFKMVAESHIDSKVGTKLTKLIDQELSKQQLEHIQADGRASSPGYHSAASSPGSSASAVSSIASPVSSSASSTSGCSGSSNSSTLSTASLLSTSTNTAPLIGLNDQISTTAEEPAQLLTRPEPAGCSPHSHGATITSSIGTVASLPTSSPLNAQLKSQLVVATVPSATTTAAAAAIANTLTNHHRTAPTSANNLAPNLAGFSTAAALMPNNGLNLTWFHNANDRASLNAALASNKLIVSGHISLAEMSRYPVPIMARPPLGVSDLTLENWITDVLKARKGIKLTFSSTRTVEPAFRVLARHAQQLTGPLILSADVLARPQIQLGRNSGASKHQSQNQQQQPVDAWTFLMLCRTRFPKSVISIGWCPLTAGDAAEIATMAPPMAVDSGPADSMLELDLLLDHRNQQQQPFNLHLTTEAIGMRPTPLHNSQSIQHHLNNHHQQHHHHHHHHHNQQPQHHLLGRQLLQARDLSTQLKGAAILSSNGSVNSSSGNSSGSPSPTSPVGHLANSASFKSSRLRHHLTTGLAHSTSHPASSSTAPHLSNDQQMSLKSWPAVAAAAVMAQLQQQQRDLAQMQDQMPLNLNINEAEPQHAAAALSSLAQTIQSLQQQSSNLNSLSSSLRQQQLGESAAAAFALASKLLDTDHEQNQQQAAKWQHVSKKAALCSRLDANSPSPVSTSPRQQNHLNQQRQHQHSTPGNLLSCVKQASNDNLIGYTREMIDKMSSLVKEYNLTQAITFPVEARWLSRRNVQNNVSLSELQRLLYQVGPNSTLTIVAQAEDLISVDELLFIRKHFAPNQILFDLPDELAALLKNELTT